MIAYESGVSDAMDKDGDLSKKEELERPFLRDFKSFIGAVRSAREYMRAAAGTAGCAVWLDDQFASMPAYSKFFDCLSTNRCISIGLA